MKARTRPTHQSLSADGKNLQNRSACECRVRNSQFKQDSVRDRLLVHGSDYPQHPEIGDPSDLFRQFSNEDAS